MPNLDDISNHIEDDGRLLILRVFNDGRPIEFDEAYDLFTSWELLGISEDFFTQLRAEKETAEEDSV